MFAYTAIKGHILTEDWGLHARVLTAINGAHTH